MCDYCDCRELTPIRELSEDHDRIAALAERLRRQLEAGGDLSATLSALQAVLGAHLQREEEGIFAQLAGRSGFTWYLDQLRDDHSRVRGGILAVDAGQAGCRERLVGDLDDLAAHISVEEYDLFPASRMIIGDAGWAEVMAVHAPAWPTPVRRNRHFQHEERHRDEPAQPGRGHPRGGDDARGADRPAAERGRSL